MHTQWLFGGAGSFWLCVKWLESEVQTSLCALVSLLVSGEDIIHSV